MINGSSVIMQKVFGILFAVVCSKVATVIACDSECQLPDCLCMGTNPPNGLRPEEIPQLVFLTFDDAVRDYKYVFYEEIFRDRYNPNGCPIGLTFYVCHDRTDYQLVNELYNQGHEIASHTVTHLNNRTYWSEGSTELWTKEIDDMREIASIYANIPKSKIQGHRAPYLQTGADSTYLALESLGMLYDSSLPTRRNINPPIWPYTLDFGETQDCVTKPCPTGNYSGLWNVPIVANIGLDGGLCHMHDSCVKPNTSGETFHYLLSNFERFSSNRAPFGVYIHATWFINNTDIFEGYLQFVDYLTSLDYVYIVTVNQGLGWIRNPLTLQQLKTNDSFACPPLEAASCQAVNCSYSATDPPGGGRVMRSCVSCPQVYPWVGNPEGNLKEYINPV